MSAPAPTSARHSPRVLAGSLSLVVVVLLAACGAKTSPTAAGGPPAQAPVTTEAPTPTQSFTSQVVETPPDVATAATVAPGYSPYETGKTVVATLLSGEAKLDVFDSATATTPTTTLQRDGDRPLVVVAIGNTPDRLWVELPVRPNGSRGWIDRTKVSLASHEFKLIVELTAHKLVAMDGTKQLLEAPIGVGKGQTPTPNGTYYITELLKPPTANSIYGSYAYGLSGFSEVLKKFGDGDGQVGIHGTNDPSSIGKDVSHGCIRLNNADIEKLVAQLPLGTPVEVQA